MVYEVTEREHAVIIDSLSMTRARIGGPTPDIDSAMKKMTEWVSPSSSGFLMVTGDDHDSWRLYEGAAPDWQRTDQGGTIDTTGLDEHYIEQVQRWADYYKREVPQGAQPSGVKARSGAEDR